ncbi:hypothetical protein NE865_05571 [Phthorimaea operculella]|nr:hypothetical protein NE865_05571 [Phthorimaea operculella]
MSCSSEFHGTTFLYKQYGVLGYTLQQGEDVDDDNDWRSLEDMAEQHSFIVALLNKHLDFICTGTIVNNLVVLTTGSCIKKRPYVVVIGAAIIDTRDNVTNKSMRRISHSIIHPEYALELVNNTRDNKTQLNTLISNIGLVFAKEPVLELFYDRATTSFFFASDLMDKKFDVIGYGDVEGQQRKMMQRHWYKQTPCLNPYWYYCICGLNDSEEHETDFGEGATLMYGSAVIAIGALSSGILSMPYTSPDKGDTENTRNKYVVFTVLGPYLTWIEEQTKREHILVSNKLHKNGANHRNQLSLKLVYIYILFVYIKLLIIIA